MQKSDDQQSLADRRVYACWRMRACGAGLCAGVQVFLVGVGVVMPVSLNASWIAALCAPVMAAITAWICRRAPTKNSASGRCFGALHVLLGISFVFNAVFVLASVISLGEHSLLPQTRSTHSLLFTVLAAFFCAFSRTGVTRLCFALRFMLPVLLCLLCALSLPLDVNVGLFPLLGAGGEALLAGCVCMLGAAFPVLLLLYPPAELETMDDGAGDMHAPDTGFFVWRAALGAAAGAALLFVLTLGSTYESIAGRRTWGERLVIISSGRPREGLAQTGLTVLQTIAMMLLAAQMLLGAQQAFEYRWPGLKKYRMSLLLPTAGMTAALCTLLYVGFDAALALAPCLLVPLLLALIFRQRLGGCHEM